MLIFILSGFLSVFSKREEKRVFNFFLSFFALAFIFSLRSYETFFLLTLLIAILSSFVLYATIELKPAETSLTLKMPQSIVYGVLSFAFLATLVYAYVKSPFAKGVGLEKYDFTLASSGDLVKALFLKHFDLLFAFELLALFVLLAMFVFVNLHVKGKNNA